MLQGLKSRTWLFQVMTTLKFLEQKLLSSSTKTHLAVADVAAALELLGTGTASAPSLCLVRQRLMPELFNGTRGLWSSLQTRLYFVCSLEMHSILLCKAHGPTLLCNMQLVRCHRGCSSSHPLPTSWCTQGLVWQRPHPCPAGVTIVENQRSSPAA